MQCNKLKILSHLELSCDQPVQAFDGNRFNGLVTYLFSQIIRDNPEITYGGLLEKLHQEIGNIHQSKFSNSILKRIFHRKIDQVGFRLL